MHMAAVVEMTVIDIEFADQLILVGVGNADAEVSRHTGSGRGRSHRLAGHFGLIARGVVPTERRGGASPPASLAADGTSRRNPRRNPCSHTLRPNARGGRRRHRTSTDAQAD